MTEAGFDRIQIASSMRLTSDDPNNDSRLNGRAILETASAALLGDAFKVAAKGIGGVLGGLMVDAVQGTNRVVVRAGLAVVASSPTDGNYDPEITVLELPADVEVDLAAQIDGANPRLVTIELVPGTATKITEARDIFDADTGTFTVDPLVPVLIGSSPTINVAAGTPGVAPQVAAGTVGNLPLAVVKLSAAQASFPDPYVPVLMCRPILGAGARETSQVIAGGGFSAGVYDGGWSDRNVAELHSTDLELEGLPACAYGRLSFAGAPSPILALLGGSPGALIAGTQALYGYAVPPPWAPDYGPIAPREAWPRNLNGVDIVATPESVVLGQGSTFASLAIGTSATSEGARSLVVVFDTAAPVGASNGTGGVGITRVDRARGQHPDTVGGATLTLEPSLDPSWGNTQQVQASAYLGAVSANGTGELMAQSYAGAGRVAVIDDQGQRPARTYTSDFNTAAIYPGRYPQTLVGNTEIIPTAANEVTLGAYLVRDGAGGIVRVNLAEDQGFGQPTTIPKVVFQYDAAAYASRFDVGQDVVVRRSDAQSVQLQYLAGGGGGTGQLDVFLAGYVDPFLAAR